MTTFTMILVAALTFGVCYLVDKGFTKAFRNAKEHRSGLSVRVSKRYATIGLILCILGILSLCTGLNGEKVLLFGGAIVLLIGIALVGYYLSFGIFYDAEGFVLMTRKGSKTYRFADIRHQKLYLIQGGSVVIELHLSDGNAASIQSTMDGAYPFLDHAFAAWCHQTGRDRESCTFYDPASYSWFPVEDA